MIFDNAIAEDLTPSEINDGVAALIAANPCDKTVRGSELAQALKGRVDRLPELLNVSDADRAADMGLVLDSMPDEIIPQLVGMLGNSNQFVQGTVIDALVKRGSVAADPVIAVLNGEDQLTVGAAVAVIRKLGAQAVAGLQKVIDPKAANYSSTAVILLAELDPNALQKFSALLAEGLGSDDQFKSSAAIRAYSAIGAAAAPELVKFLGETNPFLQQNASNVLVNFGAAAAEAIIGGLGHPNQFMQQNCYSVLLKIGRPIAQPLLRAAETGTPVLRVNAQRLLGEIRALRDSKRRWWVFGA